MKFKYISALLLLAGFFSTTLHAQSIVEDFQEPCDSLCTLIKERTGVEGVLKLKAVMKRGHVLDFYFTESLGDFPLRPNDTDWLKSTLKSLYPDNYKKYGIGTIRSRKINTEDLEIHPLTFDGKASQTQYKARHNTRKNYIVERQGDIDFPMGMEGRTIALWQSHGRYFNTEEDRWEWQRPCLFQTCEDMFTQSFVLQYLVPMLENAGAYVMLPRERDIQVNEVIADNDTTCGARGIATYTEKGNWSSAGSGFADIKETYTRTDMPFTMGTSRKTACTNSEKSSSALWRPTIPERGEYAVYVSYTSLPESSSSALYTVRHLGGESKYVVNQRIGGGTWVYLGTFEFEKGSEGYVELSSKTPEGYRFRKDRVVCADAVKFGGGMGNIAREPSDSTLNALTSGMPRSAEGATYWLQWAGADSTIYHPEKAKDDYMDDFMSRGDWVDWISGGSEMNPKRDGKGIPIDLSLGFHTDAGVTPNDSIVGTLAIYTYKSERETRLPSGDSRMTSREYADIVQSQIVNDLRADFNPEWTRRQLWDRGYRESRTPSCPAMLLELLSHQNFADMKYGLDPAFRFTVSRAIYKGMLKYMSNRYDIPYVVQPLPVDHIGIRFNNDEKAVITWKERKDDIEPTAKPEGFILYTRLDDGAFDHGHKIKPLKHSDGTYELEIDIKTGHLYSFRIEAYNDGGKSFPSETVSIGIPSDSNNTNKILIVNNFDRVSAPAHFDTPSYAGFENRLDSGVPYIKDIAYIGEMYEYRRSEQWITNDRPGFGASYSDYAGKIVAGNTFDYAAEHGKAFMDAGYSFYSCSNETFCTDSTYRTDAWTVDIICGKQIEVFPIGIQSAISEYTADGCNILISGSNIGTYSENGSDKFTRSILGYKWISGHASRTGEVTGIGEFNTRPNPVKYCIESPDGIGAVNKEGKTLVQYADTGISAGTTYQGKGYRTVCLGFPIEALTDENEIKSIIFTALEFFNK